MKRTGLRALTALAAAALAACGGSSETEKPAEASAPAGASAPAAPAAADPSSGAHEHGTVQHELGEAKAGEWTVRVRQADDVAPKGETVFYVTVTDGPPAANVRLWVGDEKATASVRSLGEKIGEARWHAHVQIPAALGPSDSFWAEIDGGGGVVKAVSFPLAPGTVLPPQGPRTGFIADLKGAGFAEVKLHDDRGDLEVWFLKDAAGAEPLDIALDAAVEVEFPEKGKTAKLRIRDDKTNPGEDGKPNLREGKTNYFIYSGEGGEDSSWLKGAFRAKAIVRYKDGAGAAESGEFVLVPHTHGPGGHH